jgi:hypothetical protein
MTKRPIKLMVPRRIEIGTTLYINMVLGAIARAKNEYPNFPEAGATIVEDFNRSSRYDEPERVFYIQFDTPETADERKLRLLGEERERERVAAATEESIRRMAKQYPGLFEKVSKEKVKK